MRTLVHLSDLHFDHIDEALIAPLTAVIGNAKPDLVVVSGDLTQRARTGQFEAARLFLDGLPKPQIVVPGNHDIPLHNVVSRFFRPLEKYRRYITNDLAPFHVDDEIAVLGINTARSLTIKNGRINAAQMEHIRERLCALDDSVTRIIVTHHPFDLPRGFGDRDLVGRASIAMKIFAGCRIDFFLAGHLHASHAGSMSERYKIVDYGAIAVQAGTTTSTRGRGESNSFNILRIGPGRVTIERMSWMPSISTFDCVSTETFELTSKGWASAKSAI